MSRNRSRRGVIRAAGTAAAAAAATQLLPGLGCRVAHAAEGGSHHGTSGFRNPWLDEADRRGFSDFLRWQLGDTPEESHPLRPKNVPEYQPVIHTPDARRILRPDRNAVQITWIGHATFLIQMDGLNILTDPMLTDRASPVSFAGPKRAAPPGLSLNSLPRIDVVIVSHNHYDHLDVPTVRALGADPLYITALGNAFWLKQHGAKRIVELDWWQTHETDTAAYHCVPAQHFSGRFPLLDANDGLWAGFVLESKAGRVYFAGDTGFAEEPFAQIGQRYGPIRAAMVPIGAYRPRWFMRPVHVDPIEAFEIHRLTGSAYSIGMHWGTFKLTDEPLAEPPIYLHRVASDFGAANEVGVQGFGETRLY